MKRNFSILDLTLLALLLLSPGLSSAKEGAPVLGQVSSVWGKKVVMMKFDDPSTVKLKDFYFLYRGDKVIGKVQVHKIGRETIQATVIESSENAQEGDLVKGEGEVVQGQSIDIDSYEKMVFPIFMKTVDYGFSWYKAIVSFFSSLANVNDPQDMEKMKREMRTAGTDSWWRYMKAFQNNFTSPEARKTFSEGDAFCKSSLDRLSAVSPPGALEKPHKRLLGLLGQLQVVFSAFKNIPDNQSTYALNYIVDINNRFFMGGDMVKYSKGLISLTTQVIEEYVQIFPEWKEKDPGGKYKKDI